MAEGSNIGWTENTWPIVQGCDYVDPGCANCYAPFDVWRQQNHPNAKISWPLDGVVQKDGRGILSWTGKVACREDRLLWPLKWKEPSLIFVPSLGDLFHEAVPTEFIDKVFAVMALCPQHTFQVLSRRTERMRDYLLPARAHPVALEAFGLTLQVLATNPRSDIGKGLVIIGDIAHLKVWPLPNVWIGASIPDRPRAALRVPHLLATEAAVRFISFEPALENIDWECIEIPPTESGRRQRLNALNGWMQIECAGAGHWQNTKYAARGIDWMIWGGESIRRRGKLARESRLETAETTLAACQRHGVAFYGKQLGHNPTLGGKPYPVTGKGTDIDQWPAWLRVQEFPMVRS